MLCAKYDYKMDIAVKQEEAQQEKAIEDALTIIRKYKVSPEEAAKDVGAPPGQGFRSSKIKESI